MAPDRSLERALLFNFAIHGIALLGMAVFLLPALPGGSDHTDAQRIAVIAEHPWQFRIGWLPWQLCAVGDLWLAVAMLRTSWLPRVPAIAVVILTLGAVVPDQYAQAVWITRGVELAQTDAVAYLSLEHELFPLTAGYGALGYTLAAFGWTWCFAMAGTWSKTLSILSVTTWATMLVAVISPLLPEGQRPSATFVSVANGIGFFQMQLWLFLVAEQVLRRARPYETHGRMVRWRHPGRWFGRGWSAIANSRVLDAFLQPVPEFTMKSDITEVLYVNYLVPAERAAELVPPGLVLQRLGPVGKYALFTFLTYKHGRFGFAFLGPLRRLCPSPIQSNWRIHVEDPTTKHRGIYFLSNAITNTVMALVARLTTEGMPMHRLASAELTRTDDRLRLVLDPGEGSAPDAEIDVTRAAEPKLEGAWAECFASYRDFLAYCVPQDRALSSQPLKGRISRHEIDLGIPLDSCVPYTGSVRSRAAEAIAGDAQPLCFHVPGVAFTFSLEAHDSLGPGDDRSG